MFHVATDVEEYAEHTKRVVMSSLVSLKPSTVTEEKQNLLSSSSPPRPPQTTPESVGAGATAATAATGGKKDGLDRPEARHTREVEEQITREGTTNGACPRPWQQHQQQAEGEREYNTSSRGFSNEVSARWEGGETAKRPSWRPLTKYEEKAREASRRVRDFSYRLEVPTAAFGPPPLEQ